MMSFLVLEGLSKRYGDNQAVKDFSLSVKKGELVCLLGPSGCGKTTILQMIAGFVSPDSGRVLLDGADITAMQSNQRGLGIVFQSYALFPHMTVAQNVVFGLQMRHVSTAEQQTRVAQALDLVHLQGFEDRYPRELSGGQCQRVALARALVIQPPVLLLDEPMGALDAKLREDMGIELRALQRRVDITTIMVTHDQHEAMTLADRIVLMHQGCVQQVDAPWKMYETPNSRFSSTFLGKANVFAGQLQDGRFISAGVSLPVPEGCFKDEADYIIRPEKIRVAQEDAVVQGTVTTRIFLGNHWLFHVDTPLGLMQLTQSNTAQPSMQEGDTVGLVWSHDSVHVVARQV